MSDPGDPEDLQDPDQDVEEGATGEYDPDRPIPSIFTFLRKGANNSQLAIVVKPNEEYFEGVEAGEIEAWIRQQGCEDWHLHEETIQRLSIEARRLEKTKEYIVAERKDCKIEVQISSDRLQAWIRAYPAFGGIPVTEDLIRKALEENHITIGINESLMAQVIRDGQCERELIAEGIPPTPGRPVKFEQLVQESSHKGVPQEKDHGRVDYKDLGLFLSVSAGTPLLRHIPPTEGTAGAGVDGTPIPAPPAVDRAPHPGIGTAFSKDSADVIVATRDGQPFFIENTVTVDPTLEIDSVGPSTGNVSFEGNVMIRGPVESGYAVNASQDLSILDTVEGATLTAGRNINLLTGVYGKGKSIITAGGKIEARFLSDCKVHCGGNLEVSDLIRNCTIECEGHISLGKSGGKGQALGGRLVALRGIQAQVLGSVSEAATLVELAPSRAIVQRLAKVAEEISATTRTLEIGEKNLQTLKAAKSEKADPRIKAIEERADALRQKLKQLDSERTALEEKVDAPRKGRIKASEVYHGVTLRIGKGKEIISERIIDLVYLEPVEKKPPQPKKENPDK
jgi:uncharacterized protein (DUF342 family)